MTLTEMDPPGGQAVGKETPPSGEGPVRVVLIDDNRIVRDRLATLLRECAGFEVVAAADGVTTGHAHVREQKPDVALVDASLCRDDMGRCYERVREMGPGARVVMMDVTPTGSDLLQMIEAGVRGFVLPDATVDEFVGTIRTVAEGAVVLPDALTPVLWSSLAGADAWRTRELRVAPPVRLTRREREIALLIGEGCANKEIARRLCIAIDTVKSHLHNILKKLDLHTRLQLAAAQAGWTSSPTDP